MCPPTVIEALFYFFHQENDSHSRIWPLTISPQVTGKKWQDSLTYLSNVHLSMGLESISVRFILVIQRRKQSFLNTFFYIGFISYCYTVGRTIFAIYHPEIFLTALALSQSYFWKVYAGGISATSFITYL